MLDKQFTIIETLPSGKYAMWWPTADEPRLINSATAKDIQRVYEAFDGFESYGFTFLLDRFGEDVGNSRYALPEDSSVQPLRGPQERLLAFSASQEKGMRFHFNVANTPASYRDEVWRMVADYAEALRRALIKQGVAPTANPEVKPINWWLFCQQAVSATESAGEPVELVGVVLF